MIEFLKWTSRTGGLGVASLAMFLLASEMSPNATGNGRQPAAPQAVPAKSVNLVIDTDAGTDDLIAIGLLAGDPSVNIEAVTVVDGLSSVTEGVASIRALLARFGRPTVPVYGGTGERLRETRPFPPDWRHDTEQIARELLGRLPTAEHAHPAVPFLARVLTRSGPSTRILTLGPLTNVGRAMRMVGGKRFPAVQLFVMGGALEVPGNLISFTDSTGLNRLAEWNVFADPAAADIVLRAPVQITLVPLDATQAVRVTPCHVARLGEAVRTAIGQFIYETYSRLHEWIDRGDYFAWDPLAAAVAVQAVTYQPRVRKVEVRSDSAALGQTAEGSSGVPVTVAEDVSIPQYYAWVWARATVGGSAQHGKPCTSHH